MEGKILLLDKELQDQALQPTIDIPVQIANIIARDVGAEVAKLYSDSPSRPPPLAADFLTEDSSCRKKAGS